MKSDRYKTVAFFYGDLVTVMEDNGITG